jgi:CubicO group peptidase (beta-lactamase class C family)
MTVSGQPVDTLLRDAVDSGAVPTVVAVAADDRGVIYEGAAGPRAVDDTEPASADSVFRIASMTKIVTTVAALQLRDEGGLDFAAPVDAYCPDFAAVRVLDGFDGEAPRLRPPASRATVAQLVTHTAGLAYGFWHADLARWDAVARPGSMFDAPMVADPGTRLVYGISTDWLGRVVEAASGQPLDGYLTAHVFTPLGMHATTFQLDDARRGRCVPVHARDEHGDWVATDLDWDRSPTWWPGGHGLYSTPRDFLRFQRMLLGGGTLGGATILAPSTVREAFTNRIGDLWFPPRIRTADPTASCDFLAGPDMKWGWGLLLNTTATPGMRSAGSGAWAGMFNTYFWVDPHAGLTAALYTQTRPFVDPRILRVHSRFERLLYAAPHR